MEKIFDEWLSKYELFQNYNHGYYKQFLVQSF